MHDPSNPNCQCEFCRLRPEQDETARRESANAAQQAWIESNGWYIHYIPGEHMMGLNAHTHGFRETFGVPDVQIVMPISPGQVSRIIYTLVTMIRDDGLQLQPGKLYGLLGEDQPVLLIPAQEQGRDVLRLILCDINKQVDADKITPLLRMQYVDLKGTMSELALFYDDGDAMGRRSGVIIGVNSAEDVDVLLQQEAEARRQQEQQAATLAYQPTHTVFRMKIITMDNGQDALMLSFAEPTGQLVLPGSSLDSIIQLMQDFRKQMKGT